LPARHACARDRARHANWKTGFERVGETLLVNHEGMLQMLDLWLLYQDFSLCNVSGLPPVTALEVERFKDMQHAHCEKIVQLLKKKWFPAVLDIFRRESSADKPDGAEEGSPLLSTVSALMFNQLRGLLQSSVAAYVDFFEQVPSPAMTAPPDPCARLSATLTSLARPQFAKEEHLDASTIDVLSENVERRPLFVVRMVVEGEGFKFAPSTQGVVKSALSIIDHFVAMMNTIPRIEGEMGKGSQGSRLLTIAAVDEEFVVNARQRLQEIVEMNSELTGTLVQAYRPFAYLLSAETDKKIDEFNRGKHTLQEFTAEISKYEKATKEVQKRTVTDVRLNLLCASTAAVKTKLCSRADELANRMREYIGKQFISKDEDVDRQGAKLTSCAELCERYKEIFVNLSPPAVISEEKMVELEVYLQAPTHHPTPPPTPPTPYCSARALLLLASPPRRCSSAVLCLLTPAFPSRPRRTRRRRCCGSTRSSTRRARCSSS
jgi:hypothetical protein